MNEPQDDGTWEELKPHLDEELTRLPERLRAPLVLCYLEGKTSEQAACVLGWSVGALRGRLAKGREVLRRRLARRKVALSATALPALLAVHGTAEAVPASCLAVTVEAATRVASGAAVASGVLSGKTGTLLETTMRSMLWTQVKTTAAAVAISTSLIAGTVLAAHHALKKEPAPPAPVLETATGARPLGAENQAAPDDQPTAADQANPATYQGVLPRDIIVHITTSALDQSLKNIEGFLTQALQGTPLATAMQPGTLSLEWLPKIAKMPDALLEKDRALQLVICAPDPGQQPPAGLLIPVSGFAQKIDAMKAGGFAVEEAELGIYKVAALQGPGRPTFMADAGNGWVCAGSKPPHVRHVAEAVKGWKQPAASADPAAAALVITVDVGKIVAFNRDLIDTGIASLQARIEDPAAMEGAPGFGREMAKFAPDYLRRLTAVAEQVKSTRSYVYADAQGMEISTYVTPKHDTAFAAFAKACSKSEPAYQLVQYLPREAALVECLHYEKEAMQHLQGFLSDAVRDFVGAIDPKSQAVLGEAVKGFFDIGVGEGAIALVGEKNAAGNTVGQSAVMYYAVEDGPAYKRLMAQACQGVGGLMNSLYQQMPGPIPFEMHIAYKENAGTAAGVPYDHVTFDVQAPEQEGDAPPQTAMMIENMRRTMEQQQLYIALLDNVVVFASGANGKKRLAEAVTALRDKTLGLGADKMFMERLNAVEDKQIAFASMYLLNMIKLFGGQFAATNPLLAGPAGEILRALPDSRLPITMNVGAREGKAGPEGETNASLRIVGKIPTPVVSETATAIMTAIMQFQMLQGGNMPAPPAPEDDGDDAPVEAF